MVATVSSPSRVNGKVVPFTQPLTSEYQTGYLTPGSLHPDAVMPCEMCGRDVREGLIVFQFPRGSGFRGVIWHGVCYAGRCDG